MLLIYSRTRKRDLIDTLYDLGLSISYDRILKILDTTKNTICAQYEKDDAVCPPNLRNGLFTPSAVFNIDHNTSSTYSKENFHGTGISLFQHPSIEEPGVERNVLSENLDYKTPKMCLPESYTNVLPLHNPNDKQSVSTDKNINSNFKKDSLNQAMKDERIWLEHVNDNLRAVVSKDTNMSWSAFKANSLSTDIAITPAIS